MSMKIFVSIASFMDHQLQETVESCLFNAKNPHNVHIAVCDQSVEYNETVAEKVTYYTFMDHRSARGPCFARHLIQTMMQDEEYFLQIDSHTLFMPNWDEYLIESIQKLGNNAVISSYPMGQDQNIEAQLKWTWHLTVDKNHLFDRDTYFNRQIVVNKPKIIQPGFLIAAGFLFTHRSFVEKVPYDPVFYFTGEEPSLALRAFTHNFDMYSIPDVPVRHNYVNNGDRPLHWERDDRWAKLNAISEQRFRDLIEDRLRGVYGLGYQRSLSDYKRYCGIDYINRAIVSKVAFGEGTPGTS